MKPEQKQRAQSEIVAMHNAKNSYILTHMAVAGMAAILQELIDAAIERDKRTGGAA